MAEGESISLEGLFQVAKVEVVQEIDYQKLRTALQWICSRLATVPTTAAQQSSQEAIAQLQQQNTDLQAAVAKLQHEKHDDGKLNDLEAQLRQLQKAAGPGGGSQAPASSALQQDAAGPIPSTDIKDRLAQLEESMAAANHQQQALLAAVSALESAQPALQRRLDAKADQASVDDVVAQLDQKAPAKALEALREAVADKADRSEVDAILQHPSSSSADEAATGTEDSAITQQLAAGGAPSSSDGELDRSAIAPLQASLRVLQERCGKKVDLPTHEALKQQVEALQQELRGVQRRTEELQQQQQQQLQLQAAATAAQDALQPPASTPSVPQRRVSNDQQGAAVALSRGGSTAKRAVVGSFEGPAAAGVSQQDLVQLAERVGELEARLAALTDRNGMANSPAHSLDAAPNAAGSAPGGDNNRAAAAVAVQQLQQLQQQLQETRQQLQEQLQRVQRDMGGLAGSSTLNDLAKAVAEMGRSVQGKADESRVSQALAQAVAQLEAALGGKADKEALDGVRLQLAMSADSGGAGGVGGDAASAAAPGALVAQLQTMLRDKASQQQLDGVQQQLQELVRAAAELQTRAAASDAAVAAAAAAAAASAGKPAVQPEELQELRQQIQGKASQEDMYGVQQQLQRLSQRPAAVAAPAADAAPAVRFAQPSDGVQRGVDGNGAAGGHMPGSSPQTGSAGAGGAPAASYADGDLQALQEEIRLVARAVAVMATGQDPSETVAAASDGGRSSHGATTAANQPSSRGAPALGAGDGGPLQQLRHMLGSGAVRHKMDWLDPAALHKMAQRLAGLEAMMPALHGGDGDGAREWEARLKKMAGELRALRHRVNEMTGGGGGDGSNGRSASPFGAADGDHAMLSSKPLFGYRCMACDRPLEKLDEKRGPHVPTNQMPATLSGHVPDYIAAVRPGTSGVSPGRRAHAAGGADADTPGLQNWYEEVHGPPAADLGRQEVGPHLPKGGWRGNQTGVIMSAGGLRRGTADESLNLPDISRAKPAAGSSPQLSRRATGGSKQ